MPSVFITSYGRLPRIALERIKELASVIDCSHPNKITVEAKTGKIKRGRTLLQINVTPHESKDPGLGQFAKAAATFLKAELGRAVDVDKKVVSH